MAKQALTKTPAALSGMTADTVYSLQFRAASRVYVQIDTAAPTETTGAFVIDGGGWCTVSRTSAQQVYVWQDPAAAYGNVIFDVGV